jgi:ATP-dependent Clp protease ATP-binding subunit ClpC
MSTAREKGTSGMKILLPNTSVFNQTQWTPPQQQPAQNLSSSQGSHSRPIVGKDTFIRRQPPAHAPIYFTGKHHKKPDDEMLFQQFPLNFQSILKIAATKAKEATPYEIKAEHVVWASIHELDSLTFIPERGSRLAQKEREKSAAQLAKALMPNHPELTPQQVATLLRPLGEELALQFDNRMEMDESLDLGIQRPLKHAMVSALKAEKDEIEPAPQALLRKILWAEPPAPSFAHLATLARNHTGQSQPHSPPLFVPDVPDQIMSSGDESPVDTHFDPHHWEDFKNKLQETAPGIARWLKASSKHMTGPIYNDAKMPPLSHLVAAGVDIANLEVPISKRRQTNGPRGEKSQPLNNALTALISNTPAAQEVLSLDRTFLGTILERAKKNLHTLKTPHTPEEAQEQALRTRHVLQRFMEKPERENYSLEAFVDFLKDAEAAAEPGATPEHGEVGRILTQLQAEASDIRIPQMAQFEKSTPTLAKHSTHMVRQAMENHWPSILLRREATDRMLALIGTGGDRTNILLNSPSGEGKTFAVRRLAQRIADNEVPPSLKGAQMVELNVSALTSSSLFKEEMDEKLQQIFKELNKYLNDNPKRKVVLFIDEIHRIGELVDTMKASGILEKKNLSFIGATTPEDWRKSSLKEDKAFSGRFNALSLPHFNQDEKLSILGHAGTRLAKKFGVSISPELLEQILIQSTAKWPDNTLRHAIGLMELSASLAKDQPLELAVRKDHLQKKELWLETLKAQQTLKGRFSRQMPEIQSEIHSLKNEIQAMENYDRENRLEHAEKITPVRDKHMRQALAVLTGERIGVLSQDELGKLRQAKAVMSRYIVGQPQALEAIEEGLREIAVRQKTGGIRNRPIASMLLCGPTGVGKTEVAKVISKEFMNNNFLRLDMSDYMNEHEISRLMGSPPGYVGHEDGGLVDQIRHNPNSVIVFDEIEKAHPQIFNVLLPILEEGELRDNKGQIVSFRNAIVMLTSNLNNQEITELLMKNRQQTEQGQAQHADPALAMREMETKMRHLLTANAAEGRPGFRPEHLGRLDYVIPFSPLTRRHVSDILDIRLREMNQEPFLKDNNLQVALSDSARARLVSLTAASSLPKAAPTASWPDSASSLIANSTAKAHKNPPSPQQTDDTPLQGGARDVRMNFDRFVNKTVFTDLTFDPSLADLENARIIVDYDATAQAFKVKAAPLHSEKQAEPTHDGFGNLTLHPNGRTLAFA